ncbi:MAG TPA: hypothetical protein VIY48_06315 [Candidatus Paceibacterota bacterium]
MKKKLLNKGDLIKTNPKNGYWGCAVVISEREKTDESDPMCHIAITDVIFRHDYVVGEIDTSKLRAMEFQRWIRLKPNEEYSRTETLIGVYSRKIKVPINIIGSIDPTGIYQGPLPFEPNHGLDVKWPLCGNVTNSLGMEAVISWRRVHDKEALEKEILAARIESDAVMAKIKEENREKRKKSKLNKIT